MTNTQADSHSRFLFARSFVCQFRVGCLYGLKICLSGYDVDRKAMLADLISRNGGTHSPSLTKFCTHLVSNDKKTQKYTFAVKHGIVCCSLDWLVESTKGRVKWCRDATKYQVKDMDMSLVISNRADTVELGTSAAVETVEAAANADAKTNMNFCEDPTQNDSVREELRVAETKRGRYDGLQGTHMDESGSRGMGKDGRREEDALESEESEGADRKFLEHCGIWYIGLSRTELRELISLCCKSGATRISFPHPTLVTHIVQGSEPCTRGDLDEVSKILQSPINPPHLVTMEWLRTSVRSRRELYADEARFRPPKEDDGVCAPNSTHNEGSAIERLDSGRSIQAVPNLILNQNQSTTNDASNGSFGLRSIPRGEGIFSGYYFTLCAVRGTGEESVVEVLIRQHGGKINNTSVPASGEGTLLAICPPSLTRIEASRLRAQNNNNFGYVAEDNRFTLYWIKCCVKAQKMLMHQDGAPCFRPLPFELPMDGMPSVSVSTSGYDDDVKSAIKHTIETIGGRFSARNMSAKDTHLIVPFAHGEKYRHSERLGVTPVTSQWLVESVKSGRILPEGRFTPGPKPGCEPDTMVQGSKLGPVEATQHAWDTNPAGRVATVAVPSGRRPSDLHQQPPTRYGDIVSNRAVERPARRLAQPSADPVVKRPKSAEGTKPAGKSHKTHRSQTQASDLPVDDDLEKASLQVTSLISRLQTPNDPSAQGNPAEGKTAASGGTTSRAPSMRPSKRPPSKRLGLNQSENEKVQPSADDQEHRREMNCEAMVEVSQRVGYD